MNWQQIETNWPQVADAAKERWSDLTPHEITVIAGKRDRLVGRLHIHYGMPRRQAETDADEFAASLPEISETTRGETALLYFTGTTETSSSDTPPRLRTSSSNRTGTTAA